MSIALNTPGRNTPRGLPLAALTLTACLLASPLYAAPMTDTDREHLLVHFEMTTQMVAEQVRGLSPDPAGVQSFTGPVDHPASYFPSGGGRA